MSLQNQIENKLIEHLQPTHLQVINESHMHNVPPGSESHFKIVIVSDEFQDKILVERHRVINTLLTDELKNQIHALSLQTFTSEEWEKRGGTFEKSPPCLGGEKKE